MKSTITWPVGVGLMSRAPTVAMGLTMTTGSSARACRRDATSRRSPKACSTLSPSRLRRSLSRRTRTRTSTPCSSRHRVTAAPTKPVEPVTSAFITVAPTLPRRAKTRPFPLILSGGDVAGQLAEWIGFPIEVLEVGDGGGDAFLGQLAGTVHAEERRVGLLPARGVRVGVLFELFPL